MTVSSICLLSYFNLRLLQSSFFVSDTFYLRLFFLRLLSCSLGTLQEMTGLDAILASCLTNAQKAEKCRFMAALRC